jgi:hypothetical protein
MSNQVTVKSTKLTEEEKAANKESRLVKKEAERVAKIEAERNQKPVKSIEMNIEWKRSRVWGMNPKLEAYVRYQDGTGETAIATASGCGYDKESTVVAEIFNRFLKYKLYQPLMATDRDRSNGHPYGIQLSDQYKYFEGGVGMSCYPSIAEAIGGKLEDVAHGKTFDVYRYTNLYNYKDGQYLMSKQD